MIFLSSHLFQSRYFSKVRDRDGHSLIIQSSDHPIIQFFNKSYNIMRFRNLFWTLILIKNSIHYTTTNTNLNYHTNAHSTQINTSNAEFSLYNFAQRLYSANTNSYQITIAKLNGNTTQHAKTSKQFSRRRKI